MMQVSAKLFSCAWLPFLASLVVTTFAVHHTADQYTAHTSDYHLIQFMSSIANVQQIIKVPMYEDKFFQIRDHHNRVHVFKFEQAYHYNPLTYSGHIPGEVIDENKPGPPIFLVVGGYASLTEMEIHHPVWLEMVQRCKGIVFVVQQRWFGSIIPDYPTDEYLRYINSEQSLYDIAYFLGVIRQKYFTSRVMVVGDGLAGKLAVWFRMKFPHLAEGAIAINPPLKPKVGFAEYFDSVSLQLSKLKVLDTIKAAYTALNNDVVNNKLHLLQGKWRLCSNPANSSTDVQNKNIVYMLWSITWNLGTIPVLADVLKKIKIDSLIETLTSSSNPDPVDKVQKAVNEIIDEYGHSTCIHVDYKEAVNYLKSAILDPDPKYNTLFRGFGGRLGLWYSCTEFGDMKTSTKENMFGDVPLNFFLELCEEVFGRRVNLEQLENSIKKTHFFYDLRNVDAMRNVLIITHGGYGKEALTITESEDYKNIDVISIPDVPNTPKELTDETRAELRIKYNQIYRYVKQYTGLDELLRPKVESSRYNINHGSLTTDQQLIDFMINFKGVRQYIDDARVYSDKFDQVYDHLNRVKNRHIWTQIVQTSHEFYEKNGPAILVVGGLTEVTQLYAKNPLWIEIAQRTNAMLYVMEHRCYGKSRLNLPADQYLHYCSSENALYDIQKFILDHKHEYPNMQWVVVGEGHGGTLAAWSRFKYAHTVMGAVVINAPVVPQKEYSEFFKSVSDELIIIGVMDTISKAYQNIENDVTSSDLDALRDKLKLCYYPNDLTIEVKKKNIQYLLWSITWTLGTMLKPKDSEAAQYATNALNALKNDHEIDLVKRLSNALLIIYSQYDLTCIDANYQAAVNSLKKNGEIRILHPTVKSGFGSREELWHSCTEFGYMKTSTKENMFGDVKLDFFIGLCKDVFGDWYEEHILDKSILTTKRFYDGKTIKASQMVVINYEHYSERQFVLLENNKPDQHFGIVTVKNIPDESKNLPDELRASLRKDYDDIFDFIAVMAGVETLEPPNVGSPRALLDDEDEKKMYARHIRRQEREKDENDEEDEEDEEEEQQPAGSGVGNDDTHASTSQ